MILPLKPTPGLTMPRRTGFSYPAQLYAPGSETSFARIIVRDNLSGRLGTLTLQVTNN